MYSKHAVKCLFICVNNKFESFSVYKLKTKHTVSLTTNRLSNIHPMEKIDRICISAFLSLQAERYLISLNYTQETNGSMTTIMHSCRIVYKPILYQFFFWLRIEKAGKSLESLKKWLT